MQTQEFIEAVYLAMVDGGLIDLGPSDYLNRVVVFHKGEGIHSVFRLDDNYSDLLWVDSVFTGGKVNRGEFVDVCNALKNLGYRIHAKAKAVFVRQWLRLGGFRKVAEHYEF